MIFILTWNTRGLNHLLKQQQVQCGCGMFDWNKGVKECNSQKIVDDNFVGFRLVFFSSWKSLDSLEKYCQRDIIAGATSVHSLWCRRFLYLQSFSHLCLQWFSWKKLTFGSIDSLCPSMSNLPWLLVGDLSVVRSIHESDYSRSEMGVPRITNADLIDLLVE